MSSETLGQRLAQVRGGLSQQEFADRIGVSRNTLVRYENNRRVPDATTLQRIIEDYEVDANWLLLGVGEPPKPELSPREACLIANYRASPEEGQRSVETMASLLAKRDKDLKDAG